MRLALDVNCYVDVAANEPRAREAVERAERVYLPFVVLAELRAGFLAGSRGRQNERNLNRFLKQPRVRVLLPDEQTTMHDATLQHQLREQGTPIPTNDIWIAALVVQHGLHLCSRDRHFDHLPQVPRV